MNVQWLDLVLRRINDDYEVKNFGSKCGAQEVNKDDVYQIDHEIRLYGV